MNLIKWMGTTSILGSIFLGIAPVDAQENASNTISIDHMNSLDLWGQPEQVNASLNVSPTNSGLNFSYNLKEWAWVGIHRDIDFTKFPELDEIMFHFAGHGAPNTLELLLVYGDGSVFKYKINSATNTSDYVSLPPHQITYLKGGTLKRSSTDPVEFSKVKEVYFYISNHPDKNDKPGKGFVVINEIKGVKGQSWMEWPIIIAAVPSVLTGIYSVI